MALFKFILKQRVVNEELDCFPTAVLTAHKHHVGLPALTLGDPMGAPGGVAVSSLCGPWCASTPQSPHFKTHKS